MFYCIDCQVERNLNKSASLSFRKCELCGNYANCFDVHHSKLRPHKESIIISRKNEDPKDRHPSQYEFLTDKEVSQCFFCLKYHEESIKVIFNKSMDLPARVCLFCAEALGEYIKLRKEQNG